MREGACSEPLHILLVTNMITVADLFNIKKAVPTDFLLSHALIINAPIQFQLIIKTNRIWHSELSSGMYCRVK
jgi:hypothetical protein